MNVNAHYSPPLSIGRARQNVSHFSSHFSTAFYVYISQDSQSPFLIFVAWRGFVNFITERLIIDATTTNITRGLCHKKNQKEAQQCLFFTVFYCTYIASYRRPNSSRLRVCHACMILKRSLGKISNHHASFEY